MTLILAIDTATPAVTAGIIRRRNDLELLAERVTVDARAHAERITPNVVAALGDAGLGMADLDAVVVGVGPGPFTGLRVGMATAAAFGHATGVPVHGVCSLDGLAARARAAGATGHLVVVTDARRREAYHARYSPDGERVSGPAVGPAAQIDAGDALLVGDPGRLGEVRSAAPLAPSGLAEEIGRASCREGGDDREGSEG